ncbi:cytochrome P450 [Streptomyces microflavus]|uniref:cytochrome P450 n=1 Tax=Streptomyces microflavus TaxID=1919 RepID=UPI0036560BE0
MSSEPLHTTAGFPYVDGGTSLRNQYAYESDRIGCLRDWARRYGDVFGYGQRNVIVNHPELVHKILARTNIEFASTVPLVEHRMTAQDNLQSWMRGRRQGARGITPELIGDCVHRLDEALLAALSGIEGRRLDLLAACEIVCGRAITDLCLGSDAQAFYKVTAKASRDILAVSRTLDAPPWGSGRRYRRAVEAENDLTRRLLAVISRRTDHGKTDRQGSLAEVLLGHPDRLPDEVVASVLRIALIGGHGTPGTALAWAALEMLRRPGHRSRLKDEALSRCAGLPYTTAFVKEVLRFHPPTWLLAREVVDPVSLGEVRLRPGQHVLFSPYLIHHDERWWDEPSTFTPDRWLHGKSPHTPHAYLPFGSGPRGCVAGLLGLTTLVRAVSLLATAYEPVVKEPRNSVARPDVLLTPARCRVRFLRSRDAEPLGKTGGLRLQGKSVGSDT